MLGEANPLDGPHPRAFPIGTFSYRKLCPRSHVIHEECETRACVGELCGVLSFQLMITFIRFLHSRIFFRDFSAIFIMLKAYTEDSNLHFYFSFTNAISS